MDRTLTDAERDERKAAAIAARRAAMPAHLRQHVERRNRERDARAQRKVYRRAEVEAAIAAEPHKSCTGCKQSLPLSAFSPKGAGKHNSRCRPCHSAKVATQKRAKQSTWSAAEAEAHRAKQRAEYHTRQARDGYASLSLEERAAERVRKAAEQAAERQRRIDERSAARSAAKACRKAESRRQAAARRAEVAATWTAYHALRLEGLIPSDPVVDEEDWELTTRAVRAGWESSGDKQCAGCKQTVPPSAMLPPGPGNFYPGRCQPCARLEWREAIKRVLGSYPSEQSRLIPLRDGTEISIGELARRHRQRTAKRLAARYARTAMS